MTRKVLGCNKYSPFNFLAQKAVLTNDRKKYMRPARKVTQTLEGTGVIWCKNKLDKMQKLTRVWIISRTTVVPPKVPGEWRTLSITQHDVSSFWHHVNLLSTFSVFITLSLNQKWGRVEAWSTNRWKSSTSSILKYFVHCCLFKWRWSLVLYNRLLHFLCGFWKSNSINIC